MARGVDASAYGEMLASEITSASGIDHSSAATEAPPPPPPSTGAGGDPRAGSPAAAPAAPFAFPGSGYIPQLWSGAGASEPPRCVRRWRERPDDAWAYHYVRWRRFEDGAWEDAARGATLLLVARARGVEFVTPAEGDLVKAMPYEDLVGLAVSEPPAASGAPAALPAEVVFASRPEHAPPHPPPSPHVGVVAGAMRVTFASDPYAGASEHASLNAINTVAYLYEKRCGCALRVWVARGVHEARFVLDLRRFVMLEKRSAAPPEAPPAASPTAFESPAVLRAFHNVCVSKSPERAFRRRLSPPPPRGSPVRAPVLPESPPRPRPVLPRLISYAGPSGGRVFGGASPLRARSPASAGGPGGSPAREAKRRSVHAFVAGSEAGSSATPVAGVAAPPRPGVDGASKRAAVHAFVAGSRRREETGAPPQADGDPPSPPPPGRGGEAVPGAAEDSEGSTPYASPVEAALDDAEGGGGGENPPSGTLHIETGADVAALQARVAAAPPPAPGEPELLDGL
eukprot:TRINITY_DN7278_c0_g1_i1.p1 TRINITY_DN7278_c0_g1~~TRINITY_DN7278_c0_g1_i1.p1  ORF type:complete len:528 (+),score=106.18 TRINITY_DN7278_c0_g1_i1:47-1585(+)